VSSTRFGCEAENGTGKLLRAWAMLSKLAVCCWKNCSTMDMLLCTWMVKYVSRDAIPPGNVLCMMTPMMWWLHCEGCCVFSGVGMRGLQLGMFGIGGFVHVAEGKEGQSFLEGGPCGVW